MADHDENGIADGPLDQEVLKSELSKLKARVSSLTDRIDALEKEAQSQGVDSTKGRE